MSIDELIVSEVEMTEVKGLIEMTIDLRVECRLMS